MDLYRCNVLTIMNHILLVVKYTIAKVKYGNGVNYKLNFEWEIKKRNL